MITCQVFPAKGNRYHTVDPLHFVIGDAIASLEAPTLLGKTMMFQETCRRSLWLALAFLTMPIVTGFGQQPAASKKEEDTSAPRKRMVQRHLVERGIKDERVLDVFRTVPRHKFLPAETRRLAYDDESIPIGEGQTITPPFDVAFMTESLQPKPTDKIYEVGTGSGYQAAILSRLVKDVYSVEIHRPLSERATNVLKELDYTNVHTRHGDGYLGWPEAAPFDAIIVTCAPQDIPPPLVAQLKEGGRMVIPLGDRFNQTVHLMIKKNDKLEDKVLRPTLFVPMTGQSQKESAEKAKVKATSKNHGEKKKP